MKRAGIRITRYPYEEPYHLQLRIAASNGQIQGDLEYYCNASDLRSLGRKLSGCVGRDAVVYELGSEKSEDRFAFYLSLRVTPLDAPGQCALVVRLRNHFGTPDREVSEIAIRAEVAAVNRFGRLLEEFGELRHRILEWNVSDGRLIECDEAA